MERTVCRMMKEPLQLKNKKKERLVLFFLKYISIENVKLFL